MGEKASVLGNSPLGTGLANLSTYEQISRAYVVFIVVLFCCVLYNLDSGERWSLNGSLNYCIIL